MNAPPKSPWSPPQAKLARDEPGGPLYAGFWRRFAAYWLDMVLVYIASMAITFGLAFALPPALAVVLPFAMMAAAWLYYALMHSSSRQATLGKMAFGIKVTDNSGERIGFLRATGRYFASWVSSILLAIGFLIAAFTARKQALHDLMAGTLVVRSDAQPDEVQAGGETMKLTVGVWLVVLLLGPIPLIGIFAAISIPAYQDYTTRAQLTEVVLEARNARTAIEEHYAAKRELPKNLAETGYRLTSRNVARVVATFDGPTIEVRAMPSASVRVSPDRGAILLRSPAPPAPFEWTCSAEDIADKYLPASCRAR